MAIGDHSYCVMNSLSALVPIGTGVCGDCSQMFWISWHDFTMNFEMGKVHIPLEMVVFCLAVPKPIWHNSNNQMKLDNSERQEMANILKHNVMVYVSKGQARQTMTSMALKEGCLLNHLRMDCQSLEDQPLAMSHEVTSRHPKMFSSIWGFP